MNMLLVAEDYGLKLYLRMVAISTQSGPSPCMLHMFDELQLGELATPGGTMPLRDVISNEGVIDNIKAIIETITTTIITVLKKIYDTMMGILTAIFKRKKIITAKGDVLIKELKQSSKSRDRLMAYLSHTPIPAAHICSDTLALISSFKNIADVLKDIKSSQYSDDIISTLKGIRTEDPRELIDMTTFRRLTAIKPNFMVEFHVDQSHEGVYDFNCAVVGNKVAGRDMVELGYATDNIIDTVNKMLIVLNTIFDITDITVPISKDLDVVIAQFHKVKLGSTLDQTTVEQLETWWNSISSFYRTINYINTYNNSIANDFNYMFDVIAAGLK